MGDSLYPTPYTEVNIVLHDFLDRIRAILGTQFVGFYLYGSLALGDFDPQTSDIDFIVLTHDDVSDEHFAHLREMHSQFSLSDSPWAGKIEAAYIPLVTLNLPASTTVLYPQIEKDTQLIHAPLEVGWVFQRYTLRDKGVIIAGPPPRSLIDPVDLDEMHHAADIILGGWQKQAREDPAWIAWARKMSNQAFIILTVCRIRYTLVTGKVVSKLAAARWGKKTLVKRWRLLIDHAHIGSHDEHEISDTELNETLDFLEDTIKLLKG